jgi:hypothetical protein
MGFTYGWGTTNEPSERFWIKLDRCTREPNAWTDEIYAAARALANAATKPLWLCASGGIDSEVMCRAFFDQQIPFSVLSIEHAARTNDHDAAFAKRWCRDRGVERRVLQLDMPSFLTDGVDGYAAQSYVSGNVFRYLQVKLLETVEEMGGYAVLGGGEQLYAVDAKKPAPTEEDTFIEYEVGFAVPLEWCRRNRTVHQPFFYLSTPELALSYLQIPLVAFGVGHPDMFRHPNNKFLFKRFVYQAMWPDITPRSKYSGFEKVVDLRMAAQGRLRQRFGPALHSYLLPVSLMKVQLVPTTSATPLATANPQLE